MHPQTLDQLDAVERSPEVLSGALRFRGTRVPVAALFENLRDGATVAEFLSWFPGVTRAQVEAVLDYTARSLHQQNLAGRRLAILVLGTTSWPKIRPQARRDAFRMR